MIECAVSGQRVTGSRGSTDQWLRIGSKQYIPAAYVSPQGTQGAGEGHQDARQVSAQRCTTP